MRAWCCLLTCREVSHSQVLDFLYNRPVRTVPYRGSYRLCTRPRGSCPTVCAPLSRAHDRPGRAARGGRSSPVFSVLRICERDVEIIKQPHGSRPRACTIRVRAPLTLDTTRGRRDTFLRGRTDSVSFIESVRQSGMMSLNEWIFSYACMLLPARCVRAAQRRSERPTAP